MNNGKFRRKMHSYAEVRPFFECVCVSCSIDFFPDQPYNHCLLFVLFIEPILQNTQHFRMTFVSRYCYEHDRNGFCCCSNWIATLIQLLWYFVDETDITALLLIPEFPFCIIHIFYWCHLFRVDSFFVVVAMHIREWGVSMTYSAKFV